MGILNLHNYKNSKVPEEYWDCIADYLSCCENEINDISEESYSYIRWNEKKVCFQGLLYSLGIPMEIHKQIEKEIRCPECGRKIELESFVSINYGYQTERTRKKLEAKINKDVHGKIVNFIDYLKHYPMLGLMDNTGREIEDAIRNSKLKIIENEIWYRARKAEKDNPLKIFTQKEMGKPPVDITPEGRFNHYGQPSLYLGNSDYVCAKEINDGNFQVICWIQKVYVKKAKILDLTDYSTIDKLGEYPLLVAGLLISGELEEHNEMHKGFYKPEYAITRFIADLCRVNNIDGIKYGSAVRNESDKDSINLVLFNDNCYYSEGEPTLYSGNEKILARCGIEDDEIIFYCPTQK